MTLVSGETASDESASDEDASDDLQNLFSLEPLFFRCFLATQASFYVDSIALICSSRTYIDLKTLKFLSMVLHT